MEQKKHREGNAESAEGAIADSAAGAPAKPVRHPAPRIAAFLALTALLVALLGALLQNVYGRGAGQGVNGTEGFYDLPEDTVQTVILGTSVAGSGVNTPLLYEEYGICAYNLGVSWQPIMCSYYWAQEAYRLHSDTLTTVVLDVSALRHTKEQTKYYKASLDRMRLSGVKLAAVADYSEDVNDFITNLVPLFYYHDRWTGLTKNDTQGLKFESENVLGYEFFYKRYLDSYDWETMDVLETVLDEDAAPSQFNDSALDYFDRLAAFCEEKSLDLVLIKVPHSGWTSSDHNAAQDLADEYGLTFLDFNYDLMDEMNFSAASDTVDGIHANYYGAAKITSVLGSFLSTGELPAGEEQDGAAVPGETAGEETVGSAGISGVSAAQITPVRDVRGEEDYAFMDELMETYESRVLNVMAMKEATDPATYLEEAASNEDNVVFLAVRNTISAELTDAQRARMAALGLTVLSQQTYGDSYLGIIDGGEVVYEETEYFDLAAYKELTAAGGTYTASSALTYQYVLSDGSLVLLESGGYRNGNTASIALDGTEESQASRGLNIVVYNKGLHAVTDSAVFDLQFESGREAYNLEEAYAELPEDADLSELSEAMRNYILYNERTQEAKDAARQALTDAETAGEFADGADTAREESASQSAVSVSAETAEESAGGADAAQGEEAS